MQRAAQPQHRHTFSFEVTPAFRQQGYCFLKADVKLIWCPNSSPIFPVHVWTYQEEGFGTRQPCWGCAWPSYLQTSLGAPGGGTMLSELPAPSQEGGQKLPSLDCMCWQFKSGCLAQPKGLGQAPGCRAVAAEDAAEDMPGALWHHQSGKTQHMAYFSARQDSWARLTSAEVLPWPAVQDPRSSQVCRSQSPSKAWQPICKRSATASIVAQALGETSRNQEGVSTPLA